MKNAWQRRVCILPYCREGSSIPLCWLGDIGSKTWVTTWGLESHVTQSFVRLLMYSWKELVGSTPHPVRPGQIKVYKYIYIYTGFLVILVVTRILAWVLNPKEIDPGLPEHSSQPANHSASWSFLALPGSLRRPSAPVTKEGEVTHVF